MTHAKSFGARLREFLQLPERIVLCVSVALFVAFLTGNLGSLRFDENHYVSLAALLWEQGPFELSELHAQRTYLYPLLLSCFWPLAGGDAAALKLLVAVVQYAVFVATIGWLALGIESRDTTHERVARCAVLVAGLWNPYWIQSTTLLLTDSLAVCSFVFAVGATWRCDLNRWRGVLATVGLASCAAMLRPAALPALGFVLGSIALRGVWKRDVALPRFAVRSFAGFVPFVPQVVLNLRNFGSWSILPDLPMYQIQLTWAVRRLRWVTATGSDSDATRGVVYLNPIEVGPEHNLLSALFEAPAAFAVAYGAHLFHVLDWGYVDTFVDDLYAVSRIPGSVFVYSCWGLVLLGLVERLGWRRTGTSRDGYWIALAVSAAVYAVFIATTQMETRYAFPVLLLALPFCGPGAGVVARFAAPERGRWPYARLFSGALAYAALMVSLLGLSLTLDLTSGRVDWFAHYLP